MLLFHILRPLQYSLICLFLIEVVNEKFIRNSVALSAPIYVLLSLFLSFQVQGINTYNSYGILIYNFLIVIWILLFLKDLHANSKVTNLLGYSAFWFSIGLLFYCVGTTFSEGLMNYLVKHHRPYALSFYYIGTILSFFLYCSIIIGFTCDKLFEAKSS
jgi:hypothetical protein